MQARARLGHGAAADCLRRVRRRLSQVVAGVGGRSRRRVNDFASRLQRAGLNVASPANPSFARRGDAPRAWGMPLMTDRIKEFLARNREDGPRLVVDLDVVRENYLGFAERAARHARLLRRQGEPGPGDSRSPRRARFLLRHGLADRDRAGDRRRRDARPHQLRQHDQEGKGHRPGLCARDPPLCGRLRGGGREASPRAPREPKCSAASCATARARNGRCRANSAVRRTWPGACSSTPIASGSSPMGCRFMSARSRGTRACGIAR